MLSIPLKRAQIIALLFLASIWLVRNTLFVRGRTGEYYSTVDQAAMIQIIIVLILGLVILSAQPLNFWQDLKGTSGRWWIILYLFGMVSYFWSSNPNFTAYRALEYLTLSAAMMLVILDSANEKQVEKNFLIIAWAVLVCQVFAFFLSRSFSLIGMKSNAIGASAVMISCYSWGEYLSKSRASKLTLMVSGIVSLFFVLISLSTGSWWAFLVGGSLIALISRRKILFLPLLLVLILVFAYVDQPVVDQVVYRQKAGMTFQQALTSRDLIWTDYWEGFQKKPVLGYGFAMVARELGSIYTTNTHNIIFAVAVGMGIAGFSIFIIYLMKLFFEMFKNLRFQSMCSVGIISGLIAGLANGQSLSFIGESWVPTSFVFVSLYALHLHNYIINNYYLALGEQEEYAPQPAENSNLS